MGNDPIIKNKRREAVIKKYGGPSPFCDPGVRQKSKKAIVEKYGVENPMQCDEFKAKAKETSMAKYGEPHFTNRSKNNETQLNRYGGVGYGSPELNEKSEATLLMRYGVKHNMSCPIIKDAVQKSFQQTIIEKNDELIGYTEDGDWICKCPHPECNKCRERTYGTHKVSQPCYISNNRLHYTRKYYNIEQCTKLLPKQAQFSTLEVKIRQWLDNWGIKYVTNDRRFGQEMDIYIPSLKLAIEVNGSYWHSVEYKSSLYHINKSLLLADHGIRCIFIWDDYFEEDIKEFLWVVIKGLDLGPWIKKWFSDIKGWPVDFGLIEGQWQEHKCIHGTNVCYDSGYIKTKKENGI